MKPVFERLQHKRMFEKIYCEGDMSNMSLLQKGSQLIRSSLRRDSQKGAIKGRQQFKRVYRAFYRSVNARNMLMKRKPTPIIYRAYCNYEDSA